MSSQFASRITSFMKATCRQCGRLANDDSRYCDCCGAYLGLTVAQTVIRGAKRAMVGGSLGVIGGAGCALLAGMLSMQAAHAGLSAVSLARVAQVCVLIGGLLGAAFDAMRDAVR